MKSMTSAEVRSAFLKFFEEQGHKIVASSSLVPGNDPTLLFTNAGMVQFKDVFLGFDKRPYSRATTSQKCMRISGKHNDLENVGPSPRHHTFFEMLGNFSFGDYFKRDAIRYGYTLLTEVYGLPLDRLVYTVYKDDDEAYDAWVNDIGVDPKRVARMGPKTNFWQMADTGPCGPTSEIHWDLTPELGTDGIIEALQREDDRFLELWNLVFMQFNRTQADPDHSGKYDDPLPAPGVDTGMGLERIVAVLQSAEANYDTDLFADIMDATQEILGHDDDFRNENYVAYRVIADHTRAATFLIADGVNPDKTGQAYIVRMVIRRAMRFAYKMGVERPFLYLVAESIIHKMGEAYPELTQFKDAIQSSIKAEEELFLRTLSSGLAELDQMMAEMKSAGETEMPGKDAFFLWSTKGLSLEITRDVLKENGFTVDEEGFAVARDEHSEISTVETREFIDESHFAKVKADLISDGTLPDTGVAYDPYSYDQLKFEATVLALVKNAERAEKVDSTGEDEFFVILDKTSFYVESGGQVSDTGVITSDDWEFEVTDVIRPVSGLILHKGRLTRGAAIKAGDGATAIVNNHRRWDIMRNHTATHLLHASLRETLGTHVRQKGSLVAPDRLRFDFAHDKKLTNAELNRISLQVNEVILSNAAVEIAYRALDDAKREGAMALFGEKYGDTVRTVVVGNKIAGDGRWSYELCGGTHVESTAEIGLFVITAESSTASGVRRIVALTGQEAYRYFQSQSMILSDLADQLHAPVEEIPARLEQLSSELEALQSELEASQRQSALSDVDSLVAQAVEINGSKLIARQITVTESDLLGQTADWCLDRMDSGVVFLASELDGRVRLTAKVTDDLIQKGVKAGDLIKSATQLVGGSGGGRPNFANGSIEDAAKLPEVFAFVEKTVTETL